MPFLSAPAQRSLLLAFVVSAGVWGVVMWRARHTEQTTLEGDLRVGSLQCPSKCRIELELDDAAGTRVLVDECALPDALRDVPGVRIVAAGTWRSPGVLHASHLFVTSRAASTSGSAGLPVGCSVRPR